jgi:hypothetical protein
MPNIRLVAQARNPIQVSVANIPNVTSSATSMRPRSAFAAVDAPAALWMIFDPSLAPVAIVVALTSSCFTFSAPLALLPDLQILKMAEPPARVGRIRSTVPH